MPSIEKGLLKTLQVKDTQELEPKLTRVQKYLNDDRYFQRFKQWRSHQNPPPTIRQGAPQEMKKEFETEYAAWEQQLQVQYLAHFAHFVNPGTKRKPDAALQSMRRKHVAEHALSRRAQGGEQLAGYLRFQRAVREAQGHDFTNAADMARIQGDARLQINE
jgi:hypothetical protein